MLAHYESPAAAMRAHEELIGYWRRQRTPAGGRLPARAHINPAEFKRHLPAVSLTDVRRDADGWLDYRLRLAGTDLFTVYGQEITGKSLAEVFHNDAPYWRAALDRVVTTRTPQVDIRPLAWRGIGNVSILWLRLPLATNGEEVDMIFGYDALVGGSALRQASGIRAA